MASADGEALRRHQFWWRQLKLAFDLPEPSGFPRIPWMLALDETEVIDRYVEATPKLFPPPGLPARSSNKISWTQGAGETIESAPPPWEGLIALAPLFRQFFVP